MEPIYIQPLEHLENPLSRNLDILRCTYFTMDGLYDLGKGKLSKGG